MEAIKRPAGDSPEMKPRNPLHVGGKARKRGPSQEVQNKGISGPTKRIYVLRGHSSLQNRIVNFYTRNMQFINTEALDIISLKRH